MFWCPYASSVGDSLSPTVSLATGGFFPNLLIDDAPDALGEELEAPRRPLAAPRGRAPARHPPPTAASAAGHHPPEAGAQPTSRATEQRRRRRGRVAGHATR